MKALFLLVTFFFSMQVFADDNTVKCGEGFAVDSPNHKKCLAGCKDVPEEDFEACAKPISDAVADAASATKPCKTSDCTVNCDVDGNESPILEAGDGGGVAQ
jgi:hypothetical protein